MTRDRIKTPLTTVTTDRQRTFVVRYLPAGARYGRANVLTNGGGPTVEFYDATYADDADGDYATDAPFGFGPLGQFVARYGVDTILGETPWGAGEGGLCLDGGNAAVWSIDAATMSLVRAWLRSTRGAELVTTGGGTDGR